MRWLGVAESFGAPWAHSVRGWLALFFPTTVLVFLQEAQTPFPHLGVVLLSAVVQHCFAGLVVLPVIALARRSAEVLPVWVAYANWALFAVARALAGAAMVALFTDAAIDLPARLSSWLLLVWIWMPLLSYTVAQLQHRQQLLAGRAEALLRRDEARERRKLTAEQIRERLVSDVSVATGTVIAEIQSALDASRHQLDAQRLERVSERLADVSAHLGAAMDRLSKDQFEAPPSVSVAPAPMAAALNFQRQHAWRWGTLSAIALAALTLPIAYQTDGPLFVGQFAITLIVIAVVLSFLSRYGAWGSTISAKKAVAWSTLRHAIAGLAGSGILWAMRWDQLDAFTIMLLVTLPYGAAVSAEVLSAAVGIANANREVLQSIADLDSDRLRLEATALENENRVRRELHDVMHGPILGRLSACAMALNFLATEAATVPTERITTVTSAVIGHLNDAARDLDLLRS